MVTFTPVSFKTSCSGGGRKSSTTSTRPSFSSVYLGVRLIDLPAPAPIASANDANDVTPIGKSDRQDALTDPPEAVEAFLGPAMRDVSGNDTVRV